MPVGQPTPSIARYTCVILTSDPTTAPPIIEVAIKGGDGRAITVVAVPGAFRWPEVGETWVVRQENNSWYLDGIALPDSYANVAPGDLVLNAPTGRIWVLGSDTGATDYSFVQTTMVSALPSDPIDGQEIYFEADATNGVLWHLRYNAGSSSTHKWEFLGGSDLLDESTVNPGVVNGASFVSIAPMLTIPLAGDYDVTVYSQQMFVDTGGSYGYLSYAVGGTAASIYDAAVFRAAGGTNDAKSEQMTRRKTDIAAATVLQMQALLSPNTGNFYPTGNAPAPHGLRVRPVRVG